MDAIGGYFEIADMAEGIFPHRNAVLVNTGRNALEYILRSLPDVRKIWLPYYTCGVVLEPLKKLGLKYEFYHIGKNFELEEEPQLAEGEYIIANNYYGIKDAYVKVLAEKYGDKLIVDCAQAFFADPVPGVKTFYSCRKYVGVADGGAAYGIAPSALEQLAEDDSALHNSHLFIRKEEGAEAGFQDYRENEKKLDWRPVMRMSSFTQDVLNHIDYDSVISRRRANFAFLKDALGSMSGLEMPDMSTFVCPMVYPFVCREDRDLRTELIQSRVYVARYWPDVLECPGFETETWLAEKVIPLPIDQRYGEEEMEKIVKIIK